MESFPFVDPDCQIYCGKSLPYMYYTGTEFCVQDKVSEAKHTIIAVPINNSASAIDTILSICSDTISFIIGEGWAIRG